MSRIRVLVVDDAVVVRRLVTDALSAAPDIEIAGTAANGRIALQKIPQVNPDLVTLDVEMPELDGLGTLREIRKVWPRLPVIMFSTLTERGASTTLDALAAGASDYVTKPANVGSVTAGLQRVRDDLVPKIRALVPGRLSSPAPAAPVAPAAPAAAPAASPAAVRGRAAVDVVAIGVSTGGPNALAAVLPALPAALPVPIVIVQHMPPMFTRMLAERLHQQSQIAVHEGQDGMRLEPGAAYIAPGNFHMTVERRAGGCYLALNQDPPENSCRPAADPLFRSVVRAYGGGVLGVVLTGMGHDGLRGAEHVRDAGGHVLAQDEATSVVWGMPGFVAKAGLADRVLPLELVAREIELRVAAGRVAAHPAAATPGRQGVA
ncbi:MAG: chemotaxis response regulator protein-glutamate methylesterase [Vicinamibacterales bacterium]